MRHQFSDIVLDDDGNKIPDYTFFEIEALAKWMKKHCFYVRPDAFFDEDGSPTKWFRCFLIQSAHTAEIENVSEIVLRPHETFSGAEESLPFVTCVKQCFDARPDLEVWHTSENKNRTVNGKIMSGDECSEYLATILPCVDPDRYEVEIIFSE